MCARPRGTGAVPWAACWCLDRLSNCCPQKPLLRKQGAARRRVCSSRRGLPPAKEQRTIQILARFCFTIHLCAGAACCCSDCRRTAVAPVLFVDPSSFCLASTTTPTPFSLPLPVSLPSPSRSLTKHRCELAGVSLPLSDQYPQTPRGRRVDTSVAAASASARFVCRCVCVRVAAALVANPPLIVGRNGLSARRRRGRRLRRRSHCVRPTLAPHNNVGGAATDAASLRATFHPVC